MPVPDEIRRERPGAARIEVQCLSCGRFGSFAGDDQRVAGRPLVELTKRLRCSECGSRAVRAQALRTPRDLARILGGRLGQPATKP